jgi:hypothetical protein
MVRQERRNADNWQDVLWERNFEWEPGDDGQGHPHWHTWFFCPYLEQHDVAVMWRAALVQAGLDESAMPRTDECQTGVIVDMRRVKNGKKGADELIKYMTKDLLPDGQRISPETMARLYMTLDGRRRTQASKGFFAVLPKGAKCAKCGQTQALEVTGIRPIGAPETMLLELFASRRRE